MEDAETLVLVHDPADGDGGVSQDDVVSQPVPQGSPHNRQQVGADCQSFQLLLGDGGVSLGKQSPTNHVFTGVLTIPPLESSIDNSNLDISCVRGNN